MEDFDVIGMAELLLQIFNQLHSINYHHILCIHFYIFNYLQEKFEIRCVCICLETFDDIDIGMDKLLQPCDILHVHFIAAFDNTSPCCIFLTEDVASLDYNINRKVFL